MKSVTIGVLAIIACHIPRELLSAQPEQASVKPGSEAQITVHADKPLGKLKPIWRYFGADEPNYAYMKDGKKLLGQLGGLAPKSVYFRTHNLLNTGPGAPALKWGSTNAYTETATDAPIYDWKITDLIFDTYLKNGVRPYLQVGFMPQALSTKPEPYDHQWRPGLPYDLIFQGWAYPPKDYDRWRELVFQWVKHCVERYGPDEVSTWYFEVWNEPNIGYWKGTPTEFYKTHDYAVAGILKALPNARVGGPDSAGDGGKFSRGFYQHCLSGNNFATGEKGTKLDFVSFHAKGSPDWATDHIRMGISAHLRTIDAGFRLISDFPELKGRPIIIGESDPEGCAACQGNRFAYRNGTMYSSYTAASFARKWELAKQHDVNLEGALTWAFTFEDQPYFAGFRQLASNGIPLPVLNVFRMFSRLPGDQIEAISNRQIALRDIVANGVRGEADIGVLATGDEHQIGIITWHYHDDDLPSPPAKLTIGVDGLASATKSVTIDQYFVDQTHGNAYALWQKMGSPIAPNQNQYREMLRASELTVSETREVKVENGKMSIECGLERQGVALHLIQWAN